MGQGARLGDRALTGSSGSSVRLVIVIAGPIASGKSSLAAGLARALDRAGLACATIDLDLLYEMLEHTDAVKSDPAVWARSRRMAGALTRALIEDGVSVVIAEGEFLGDEARSEFVSMLPERTPLRSVTLRASLSTAFARVDRDHTRVISRDHDFLERHYAQIENALETASGDGLLLDTDEPTVGETVRTVLEWAFPAHTWTDGAP